jgi:hypothetical protein
MRPNSGCEEANLFENKKSGSIYPAPLTDEQNFLYWLPWMKRTICVGSHRHDGELDIARLTQALRQLVETYDILRCSFGLKWLRARQTPLPVSEMDIRVFTSNDFDRELPGYHMDGDHEQRIRALEDLAHRQRFSVAHPPLFRLYAYTDEPGKTVLVFAVHHLASDMASLGLFFRSLLEIYEKGCVSHAAAQFPVYAQGQRQRSIESDDYKRNFRWHLSRLRSGVTLAGLFPARQPKQLHSDAPKPAGFLFALDQSVSEKIQKLCADTKVSPHILFLAAVSMLSSKRLGRKHLYFMSFFNGRVTPASRDVIGCLVKMVNVYTSVDEDAGVEECIKSINKAYLAACMHSTLSIWQMIGITRRLKSNPNREYLLLSYEPQLHLVFKMDPTEERRSFEIQKMVPTLDLRVGDFIANRLFVCAMYKKTKYTLEMIEGFLRETVALIEKMSDNRLITVRDCMATLSSAR